MKQDRTQITNIYIRNISSFLHWIFNSQKNAKKKTETEKKQNESSKHLIGHKRARRGNYYTINKSINQ